MFNPGAPNRYRLPTVYLSVSDIANSDLLVCGCRNWNSLDISRFSKEQCQSTSVSAWPTCQKTVNRDPIAGDRRGRQNWHSGLANRCANCV